MELPIRYLLRLLFIFSKIKVRLEKHWIGAHLLVLNNGAPSPIGWTSSIMSVYDEATPYDLNLGPMSNDRYISVIGLGRNRSFDYDPVLLQVVMT